MADRRKLRQMAEDGCGHLCLRNLSRAETPFPVQILEALDKIKAGERFDTVAAACSEDKARQGGDLGWKTRQEVVVRAHMAPIFRLAPAGRMRVHYA